MTVRQLPQRKTRRLKWPQLLLGSSLGLCLLGLGGVWLAKDSLTYRGVPLGMLLDFLEDPIARKAYFKGDRVGLHQRLETLQFEERIKAFYRPQIPDEAELDRYIHQLMYDNTGYVGKAYRLGAGAQLIDRDNLPSGFQDWMQLAMKLGIAKGHTIENGEIYIETPQGQSISYKVVQSIYPLADLKRLAAP